MRQFIAEAVRDAKDFVGEVVSEARDESALTEREALDRYVKEHKGKPWALLEFVKETAPPEVDYVESAMEYETAMERALRTADGGSYGK